nr:putative nucleotidyltransferase, ribonuclease H [Tanacetum cinerariifolium]
MSTSDYFALDVLLNCLTVLIHPSLKLTRLLPPPHPPPLNPAHGQTERTIQTLKDVLRSCALEWTGNWDDYICLVEFAYNNSWHASIKCAPFEMLYGRKCRAPICWDQVGERVIEGPEMIEVTNEKVSVSKEKLKEARTRQKSYADKHRRSIVSTRSSNGKQKIEIEKSKAKSSRQVTFSRRRAGLFKKAIELCVLIGAKVGVLVKSHGGKVYMLGEDLIDDWYGNDVVETGQLGFPTNEFNECYGNVSQEVAVENSSNSEQESNIRQLEEMKKDAVDELKMNSNIPEKLGSEEMKKNLVMEDDNYSMMMVFLKPT